MSQLSKPSIDLGLNFLKKVGSDSTNLLLSPLSVIMAYGMALEGAAGETAKQIRTVLNLDKVDSQQGDVSKIIKQHMEKYLKNKNSTSEEKKCLLEFGNLLMANKDFRLQKTFVQNLQTNYSANAFNEDFTDGQNILEKVNSWVSAATRNKISTILDKPPEPDAVCLLVNTIYFQANWLKPFYEDSTEEKIFTNSDGSTTKIKMMTLSDDTFNFAECLEKKLKIVEIPYFGNISMVLILPTGDNNLKKMIDNLDSTELFSLIDSMSRTRLGTLTIPKFKLEDNHQLHKILPRMGMTRPFQMNAEFPRITEGSLPLYISKSIQKQQKVLNFIADPPFLFFISDNLPKVNLFMGQLNNITSQQII
uniref:Serpin domain-containing protein n=2 Tax=Tetranychus urticae TaxID=32264 RepID=T1KI42_TETUR